MQFKDYPKPAVTVDIVVFSIIDNDLKVLLIKRNEQPFKDVWALPGGFVRMNENIEDAAVRELLEETNVKDHYVEQLYTFGDVDRDPRGRVITVTYFALINSIDIKLKASTDAYDVNWFSLKKIPQLAFDHREIINYALKRLRYKLEYTIVGIELLPELFTLTQLQNIYEIILDEKIDKRNFRKKIDAMDFLQETGKKLTGPHRPAMLYKIKKQNKLENFKKPKLEK